MQPNLPLPDEKSADDQSSIMELQAALHAIGDRLQDYVKRQMSADLRGFVEPQDILQDTIFEAFQRSGEFRLLGEGSAYRWLATIARHRILALLRMKHALKRGGKRPDSGAFGGVVGALQELAVYTRTPSQSAMSHEMAKVVQESMISLQTSYREALQFRYIDGLSVKQIANRMGCTDGAVLMLCNRGLKALKAKMESASRTN